MKRIWFSCLIAAGVGVIAATAQAQYSALRDYEITLDVADEPGKVADERYELDERYQRRVVFYRTTEPVGTIIVETRERMLYLVMPDNRAMRYGIGVGRDGFRWKGLQKIARKAEWPDWRPPAEMIERQPYLPRFMAGGPGNPLGVPHPRHQSAANDRSCHFVGVLPSRECRRYRLVRAGAGRDAGGRPAVASQRANTMVPKRDATSGSIQRMTMICPSKATISRSSS